MRIFENSYNHYPIAFLAAIQVRQKKVHRTRQKNVYACMNCFHLATGMRPLCDRCTSAVRQEYVRHATE